MSLLSSYYWRISSVLGQPTESVTQFYVDQKIYWIQIKFMIQTPSYRLNDRSLLMCLYPSCFFVPVRSTVLGPFVYKKYKIRHVFIDWCKLSTNTVNVFESKILQPHSAQHKMFSSLNSVSELGVFWSNEWRSFLISPFVP